MHIIVESKYQSIMYQFEDLKEIIRERFVMKEGET
jgi:hypothetical protein